MKSTKTMAVAAVILLAFSGVWFLPSVAGQGQGNSLVQRVAVLEALVADLTERVEELEGQGPGTNSFDVLHLNPLADFPSNPSEGDLCVVVNESGSYHIYCYLYYAAYLNSDWRQLDTPQLPRP